MALGALYQADPLSRLRSAWRQFVIPAVLVVFVFLFSSKSGLFTLLLLGAYVAWNMIVKQGRARAAIAGMAACAAIFLLFYFFAPQFSDRIRGLFSTLSGKEDVRTSQESTASRLAAWKASAGVIRNNWATGTGTGDDRDALKSEYARQGLSFALEEELNAHSQFLQTFITLGLGGLVALSASLFLPLWRCRHTANRFYAAFLALVILNCMIESVFELQAGVVFYAFFNSLLLFSEPEKL